MSPVGSDCSDCMTPYEACPRCGLVHAIARPPAGSIACCTRCGATIERRRRASLERTAALSIAAMAMYLPANLLPLLSIERFGVRQESTVWQGVSQLYERGSWGVATIVFFASMVIPLAKLMGLAWLSLTAGRTTARRERARLHRLLDFLGPWAMLDVFLVAVLVALVKFGDLAIVLPGPGLAAYATLVILSMLATASFDPRLVWENDSDSEGATASTESPHPPASA